MLWNVLAKHVQQTRLWINLLGISSAVQERNNDLISYSFTKSSCGLVSAGNLMIFCYLK